MTKIDPLRLPELYDAVCQLHASLQLDEVIDATLKAALKLLRAARVFVVWPAAEKSEEQDAADRQLVLRTTPPLNSETLRQISLPLESVSREMAQSQRSIFLLDAQNDLRLAVQPLAALFASQAIIAALLIYPGKQIGLLLVCKPTFEGSFSRDDLSLCEAFAKQAANAMGQAQQQAELRETNVHFVQSFGHDMGGHTTIIAGYASLMLHGESGPLSDQQRTWLVTVRKHANQLTSLIRDVRNVAEIEFQAVRIRVSPVDLAATIRQAVVSLKANLDSRQQLLILDVPALPLVKADEWRLSQILVNLLSNASKFSPENGRITVSGSTQNSLVRVVVTDTGPGMDTEDQARLFTRGFCAKLPPEYRELCGNGVGLYIAKNLIELMGGQIGFESEPGKGSTFWFTVPVADSAENPLA